MSQLKDVESEIIHLPNQLPLDRTPVIDFHKPGTTSTTINNREVGSSIKEQPERFQSHESTHDLYNEKNQTHFSQ